MTPNSPVTQPYYRTNPPGLVQKSIGKGPLGPRPGPRLAFPGPAPPPGPGPPGRRAGPAARGPPGRAARGHGRRPRGRAPGPPGPGPGGPGPGLRPPGFRPLAQAPLSWPETQGPEPGACPKPGALASLPDFAHSFTLFGGDFNFCAPGECVWSPCNGHHSRAPGPGLRPGPWPQARGSGPQAPGAGLGPGPQARGSGPQAPGPRPGPGPHGQKRHLLMTSILCLSLKIAQT